MIATVIARLLAPVTISACSGPATPRPATVEIAGLGPGSVAVAQPAAPPSQSPAPTRPGATAIAWLSSDRDAREQARSKGLPMLVWVRADWAAAALQMERSTWTDPAVVRAAGAFVALRLDVTEIEGDAELLARRYAVDTMPSTILIDPSGRTLALLRGYADVQTVVTALGQVTGQTGATGAAP